jgi:hypothetical protein
MNFHQQLFQSEDSVTNILLVVLLGRRKRESNAKGCDTHSEDIQRLLVQKSLEAEKGSYQGTTHFLLTPFTQL